MLSSCGLTVINFTLKHYRAVVHIVSIVVNLKPIYATIMITKKFIDEVEITGIVIKIEMWQRR